MKPGKPATVNGAYGPRIKARHGFDQLQAAVEVMRRKDGSRRTVMQIYAARDLIADDDLDVPCTTTIQFHRRGELLHMSVTMRSNDAYLGLPHDVFCFTMLQELVAAELGLELGEYIHMVGSMHLYDRDTERAESYRKEGYQRAAEMPAMPRSEPFRKVEDLLSFERKVRARQEVDPDAELGDPYWSDLCSLLMISVADQDDNAIKEIASRIHDNFYHSAIEDQRDRKAEELRKAHNKARKELSK